MIKVPMIGRIDTTDDRFFIPHDLDEDGADVSLSNLIALIDLSMHVHLLGLFAAARISAQVWPSLGGPRQFARAAADSPRGRVSFDNRPDDGIAWGRQFRVSRVGVGSLFESGSYHLPHLAEVTSCLSTLAMEFLGGCG